MFVRKSSYEAMKKIKDEIIEGLERENNSLKEELKESKDLKRVLEAVGRISQDYSNLVVSGGTSLFNSFQDIEKNLSDAIPRYVEDIFGGKVIKQEARKAIIISKDGSVQTGLTKKEADNGYSYVLVRD